MADDQKDSVNPLEDDIVNLVTEEILKIFPEEEEDVVRAGVLNVAKQRGYEFDTLLELASNMFLNQVEETTGINGSSQISADTAADGSDQGTSASNPSLQNQNTSALSGTAQASSAATQGSSSTSSSTFSGATAASSATNELNRNETLSSNSDAGSVKRKIEETNPSPRLSKKAKMDNINDGGKDDNDDDDGGDDVDADPGTVHSGLPTSSDASDETKSQSNPTVNQTDNISDFATTESCEEDELICDVCKLSDSLEKFINCNNYHLVCKRCLKAEVTRVIYSEKAFVQCPAGSCNDIFSLKAMKPVLPTVYFDVIRTHLAKKQAAASEKTIEEIGTMSCPSCMYRSELAQDAVSFQCANQRCKMSCCRYCKSVWTNFSFVHVSCFLLTFSGRECLENNSGVPASWTSHDVPESPFIFKNDQYMSVGIGLDSEEGKALIAYYARSSQMKVDAISRIQNKNCWEKYALARRQMIVRNGQAYLNEKFLFHGTSRQNVFIICHEGFDSRKKSINGTKYGKANYFSSMASYSETFTQGSNLIFVARVLCGLSAVGDSRNTFPPYINGRMCDSCVDILDNPLMYMVYSNDQCYPEYLIRFK